MIRLSADQRKGVILKAIGKLAVEIGVYGITYDNVAETCEVETSRHTVKHYFRTKQLLHAAASDHLSRLD